jgi:O-acetyl-ADP-ribose deacetylase (regulator of RNase III)
VTSLPVGQATIEVEEGDLLAAPVDAIVNPANERLEHGGGLARLIARAAGPELQQESVRIGFVATGQAVATSAGRLPHRYVLHTPGPVWHGGDQEEPELLASCHRAVVALAADLGCQSLAVPGISTGIFGYPVEQAAPVALRATRDALAEHSGVTLVRFCLWGPEAVEPFRRALETLRQERSP